MDITEWIKLAIICILGAMSPGPSLVVILRNSISGGREKGIFCGIGHGIGITFYSLIAVFGLFTFINNIPNFLKIIQILGSIYLIWMGCKMIISFFKNEASQGNKIKHKITGKNGFIEGFLIAFLNPKIIVWMLALFSQFVKPSANIPEQILLISTVGGVDTLWYCFVATLASSKLFVKKLNNYVKKIDLLMGIILIFLAIGMILKINSKI